MYAPFFLQKSQEDACDQDAREQDAPSLRDSGGIVGLAFPALKRWANLHCAYGAGFGKLFDWEETKVHV